MNFTRPKAIRVTRSSLICLLLILAATSYRDVNAQSSIDGSTPAGQARGTPAGTYALSGFDNVNLFNGHLNFHLPLMKVGGRGQSGYTMMLPIEQIWTAQLWDINNNLYIPNYNWWDGIKPGFSPGVVQARHQSAGCDGSQMFSYVEGVTRLTFTASDGTEYELIDPSFGGQPTNSICDLTNYNPNNGISRGTTFVSRDGSAATFIADQPIRDVLFSTYGPYVTYPSGYLKLRDGTVYRIVEGHVEWLRDRNGNKISFTYDYPYYWGTLTTITDQLNRQITFEYNVTDAYGLCTRINFKGAGGASRTLRVVYKDLQYALDAGQSLKTYGGVNGLFPELNGSSSTNHNPRVTSGIVLPDGRSYQFLYNSYGELTRVTLPVGGVITYVWGAGMENSYPSGVLSFREIYRRVLEKRTYSDNGVTLASLTTFGRYDNIYGPEGSAWLQERSIDGNATVISQSKHYFNSGPQAYIYNGGYWLPDQMDGKEKKSEDFNASGSTVLQRLVNTWAYGGSVASTPINPHVTEAVKTIEPGGANLFSKQTFLYDAYDNRTDVYDYDINPGSPGSLIRRTQTQYLTTNPVNGVNYTSNTIHIRSLPKQISVFDAGGIERARATMEYDNYAVDSFHNSQAPRSNISGLDAAFTSSYTTRGNVTASTSYLLVNGSVTGSITGYRQYDTAGNVVKVIDPRSTTSNVIATTVEFNDRFGTADGEARLNSAPAQLGGLTSYAFPTKTTNAVNHTVYTQFDYFTGKPVDGEDPNGFVSSAVYNDALERPTQIRRAAGTAIQNQTTFSYDDPNRVITTSIDRDTYNDNLIAGKILFDQLGREIETRQYEGGGNYIAIQSQYDALGRKYKVSNAFRPWQSESAVWTTQLYDALGRVTSVTTPDNSVANTSYWGNTATVTDQTGKQRKSQTDGVGRLRHVYEDPAGLNYLTTYTYDVLDNLVSITQGAQGRTFAYDSLKRMTSYTAPESGTTSYQYDNNGNVLTKTDARGVVSTYAYDALNRNTTLDYSNTAVNPDINRYYDGAVNGKGRFWHDYAGGINSGGPQIEHRVIDNYDAMGRPTVMRQWFQTNGTWDAVGGTLSRGYNLAGSVLWTSYPSTRTVAYAYDSAGRATSMTGSLGDGVSRTYSSGILYSPLGGLAKEQLGTNTPIYNKLFYNSRGQLSEIRVSTSYTGPTDTTWNRGAIINHYSGQCWGACNGTDNNGNLKQQDHWIPDAGGGVQAIFVQNYDYDSLNRLLRVREGAVWQQEFVYDQWNNRTIHQTNSWGLGINKRPFSVNTSDNRLGVPGGQSGSMTYDAAGNLTVDTYSGYGTANYDAENKVTAIQDAWSNWSYYNYDADGRRTRRKVNNQETRLVYGFDGELVAEYPMGGTAANPTKEYGYRNGQLLVTATAGGCGAGYQGTKTWSATGANIYHATGQQEGSDWAAYVANHSAHAMVYGPYDTAFGQGHHQAQFLIQVDNTNGNDVVATLDVAIGSGATVLASRQIRRNEFSAANQWQWFTVEFDNPCFGTVEARIWWHDVANMKFRELKITPVSAGTVQWMVNDQLGTPRMVFDQSGSLSSMKRHDYLPFGEELYGGTVSNPGPNGRTTALGYSGGDGIRQQFTQKERDLETGLDYFGARYYSSTQGRFTSVDPVSIGADRLFDPQRFNRYAYVRNNPLMFSDPDGRDLVLGAGDTKRTKKAMVEIAKRPGGRELLEKMDKLTIQIMVSTGETKTREYGSIGPQDPSKNEFSRKRDEGGKIVDIKGDPLVITLDFKRAEANRKENEKRIETNKGMEELGMTGKPLYPDVPKTDAQLMGHEIAHGEARFFQLPNTEESVTERIDKILAQPVDKNLAKDAEKFVDKLLEPNPPAGPPQQSPQQNPGPKN